MPIQRKSLSFENSCCSGENILRFLGGSDNPKLIRRMSFHSAKRHYNFHTKIDRVEDILTDRDKARGQFPKMVLRSGEKNFSFFVDIQE